MLALLESRAGVNRSFSQLSAALAEKLRPDLTSPHPRFLCPGTPNLRLQFPHASHSCAEISILIVGLTLRRIYFADFFSTLASQAANQVTILSHQTHATSTADPPNNELQSRIPCLTVLDMASPAAQPVSKSAKKKAAKALERTTSPAPSTASGQPEKNGEDGFESPYIKDLHKWVPDVGSTL